MKIQIPLWVLKALASTCVKNSGYKNSLDGILVEYSYNSLSLVTSDTHRLTVFTSAPMDTLAKLVDASEKVYELKSLMSIIMSGEVNPKTKRVTIDTDAFAFAREIPNVTFPKWRKVIPEDTQTNSAANFTYNTDDQGTLKGTFSKCSFKLNFLMDLFKIRCAANKDHVFKFNWSGEFDPAKYTEIGENDAWKFIYVVMPNKAR